MSQTPPDDSPVQGAYCAVSDLRTGDIRLPPYLGTPEQIIKKASDEIDAALGHIYKTPINFPVIQGVDEATYRPAKLTLKKINWLIASGRSMLDMAAVGEDTTQHAYGLGMLKEGLALLKQIETGEMRLTGAELIESGETDAEDFTGPSIHNEDPASLVETFYQQRGFGDPRMIGQASPYGIPGVTRG
jgi:hypothetical protein